MSNIINKLNALVRSNVHSVLDRGRGSSTVALGREIDREIAALREQIDTALDQEDALTEQIDAAQKQIAAWDQQADQALLKGDEAAARRLIQKIQREQRQVAFIEADLEQHRRSTAELIEQVNALEAVVAAARKQEQEQTVEQAEDDAATPSLSERLRSARQAAAQDVEASPPTHSADIDDRAVDDDLAQRRARLSQ